MPDSSQAGPSSKSRGPPSKRTVYEELSSVEPFYLGSGPFALTSDGRFLFTAIDTEVLCTDLAAGTGEVVGRFEPDGEEVSTISLTASGSRLCVTTRAASCTLYVYSITSLSPLSTTQTCVQARAHDAPVALAVVDPTDTLLATGSADGIVKLWDIAGGFVTHVLRGHGGVVSAVAFDVDYSQERHRANLATSSVDGRIRVWDLSDRPKQGVQKPVATLGGHVSVVRGLSISKNGKRMVSGSRDQTLCLWTLASVKGKGAAWTLRETLSVGEGVEACAFLSEEDDVFYTAGTSSELRLWSFTAAAVHAQQPRGRWERGSATDDASGEDEGLQGIVGVQAVEQSFDGSRLQVLASFHADSRIAFRAAASSSPQPPLSRLRQLIGFNDEALGVATLGNDSIAVATNSSAIRIYPLPSASRNPEGDADERLPGSVRLLPDEKTQPGHSDNVLSIDATASGKWIASGSKDRTARIWASCPEHDEWRCIAIAEGHAESVGAVCFSKKTDPTNAESAVVARFLVTASQDRTIKIWDLSSLLSHDAAHDAPARLKSLITLKVHEKAINSVEVAPNDSILATGSQDRTSKLFSLAYSPPSKANNQTPSATLKPLAVLKGHKRGVWSVAFSPVDPALLTTSGDRTAKLWSLKDFTCVKTFEGHSHSVLKGHFLEGSQGTQLVTSGADGLVKIWNVRDEECTTTLDGPEDADRLWSVTSFASGAGLATVGADGYVRYYKDVTQQRKAEELQTRERDVEREQQYENLLAVEDYRSAILVCLAEGQPKRLLSLFNSVAAKSQSAAAQGSGSVASDYNKDPTDSATRLMELALRDRPDAAAPRSDAESITGLASVDAALATLPSSQLVQLLTYIRAWNASTRTAGTAQNVLHCLLRSYSADEILDAFEQQQQQQAPSRKAQTQGLHGGRKAPLIASLPELLGGLIPFSERHYNRAERTLIESSVLEYTVRMMGDLVDEVDEAPSNGNGMDLDGASDDDTDDDDALIGDDGELDSELEDYMPI
ncbi:unnamed protein product [Parajaminaea phylloscopi]